MTYQPYTYLVADLLTNQILGELPLTNVTFSTVLNDVGTFQGSALLSDPTIQKMNLPEITAPGRSALYVDRGGTLVWGGIIWQRPYAVGSQMGSPYALQFTADEFPSYFKDHRFLASDRTYTNEDQLAIATDLINYAQSFASGNIGVHVPAAGSSGVLLTEAYVGTEYKSFWSMVTDMASTTEGFDAMIDVGYGFGGQPSGVPGKVLTLSYPRRGRRAPDNGLVLEYPGNIAQYSWPEDATSMANSILDTGPGSPPITAGAVNSAPLQAGYPLLEGTHSYTDSYITQAILDSKAQADMRAYANGVTLPVAVLAPGAWPQPGEYIVGDDVAVSISDYRFPRQGDGSPGLSTYMRINRIDYTPPGQSQAEIVQLTLGPVPQ